MKIAIVHEMLIKLWGAERVLQEFMKMYPEADVFTLMFNEEKVGSLFPKEKIHCTGPAQWLYKLTQKPRASLPLMTFSVGGIDLSGYDLIISSSSWFAHGVNLANKQRWRKIPFHICYCHSPARYLWDWSDEIQAELGISKEERKNKREKNRIISFVKIYCIWPLVRALFAVLRKIDLQASQSPDIYVANSREVQGRIQKYYKRDSVIIYPPVDIARFIPWDIPVSQRSFYVITSALTPFKRVDIPIRVLSRLGIRLKIIGAGAQEEELKQLAGPSVEFLGRLSDEGVVEVYKQARWFLMPQKEDAGIAPIEAMAAGLPVFGQAAGGLLETSIDGVTGSFFPDETDESFEKWFLKFHQDVQSGKYDDAGKIISHAERFWVEAFRESFSKIVDKK